jgi:hypothetical protein
MAARTRQNPTAESRKILKNLPANSGRSYPRLETISVRTFEDQATETDRLGFEPYVKAIAKFLTNKDTKPPLVLSIEGEWGSGKTSFMLQLRKELTGSRPIIWFDPWRYDKEEELWAVFASHFIDQVIQSVSLAKRSVGHIKRFIRRYQWREGWFDLTIKTITWIGLFILILVIGQNAFLSGDQWVDNIYTWISNKDTDLYKTFIETGIRLGGITGFLVLIVFTVGKLMPIIEDPLKVDLRKYISSPNYEDRVPFLKRFQDDFKEILDIYIGQQKVFVFVDDLDRCEVPKAADVMSAINLMIGDDSRVVFIIAMDREKVAAGLAVKYERLLPYILASRIYNRSTFSNRELIGLEFGYEFIEKFVQLPFRIPQPDIDKIDNLLVELQQGKAAQGTHFASLRTQLKDRFKSLLPVLRKSPGHVPVREEAGGEQSADQEKADKPKDGEDSAKNKRRENIIIQTGPETASFISIVKQVAAAFDYNPRRIKQFINLFRLRVYIAAETGLFDEDLNKNNECPLTLEKVAKLTAMELRWPIFMVDIQADANTLTDLQQLAYGISLKEISPRVELWRTRQDLMNFLKLGSPALAANANDIQNLWDLSGINLIALLRVSPKIHELTPFAPGKPEALTPRISEVFIANPNPDPNQPAEYILVEGKKKYNLAGEFCVAFIGKDSIDDFLDKWKKASPSYYALAVENDQPAGIEIVENMLGAYGYQPDMGHILNFEDGLTDPTKGFDLSPSQFKKMLETYYLMAGVFIEQRSYKLAGNGIGIWVVLNKIMQNDVNETRVEIYNPYPNQRQEYSYDEFTKSMGGAQTGLWVKRQIA